VIMGINSLKADVGDGTISELIVEAELSLAD
jgi:hypothetical protein